MNVYDCKNFFLSPVIIVPILIGGFGIYCLCNLTNPFVVSIKKILLTGIACILLSVLVFICVFVDFIKEYKNVFLEYKNGNYEHVEGYVRDLEVAYFLDSGSDSFKVGDKEFVISNDFGAGYKRGAAYGGVIDRNGLYVKIKYIPYDNSYHIMSIDILEQ